MMNSVLDINISHKYLHLFAVILFLIASAIVMPEYEFPDEYHHITSTLDPGRHLGDPNMEKKGNGYNYWYTYNKIFSYLNINLEYKDPFLRVKNRIFDSTSVYVQIKSNSISVIYLRVLQLIISLVVVFFMAYLLLDVSEFDSFVSLLVLYISWPLVSSSIIGFNSAGLLYLAVPLIFVLMSSKKYFLAFLISYGCYYMDNQAIIVICVVVLAWVFDFYIRFKEQFYIYIIRIIHNKFFVILILLSLVVLLHTYAIQILGFMGNKIGVFYSQASYLKRDLFSTGIIFFFTSLHYNGSLTSFNYYPVYIGYFYLLYRSVWFCSVKKCMSDGFVNILSSITIALIFITFFGDLTNVRYHLYIVPIIISAFVFYFNYKGISSNYIVYAGLLISTIGMYKFISESYGLV